MNELKRYLPPLMKTPFWKALMDSVEEVIAEIKTEKMDTIKDIYSLSDSSEEELIEIAHTIYRLDEFMLKNMLEFLTEIELYQTDNYEQARARALERFRQEIMKIPFSMDKRGTLQFYASILEFCDFNYHGIISLVRTQEETRIAPLITNLTLNPADTTQTNFIIPETSEDFSGIEEALYDTLDRISEETQDYTKLDEKDGVEIPTLDMVSNLGGVIAYRKIILLGLLIDDTTAKYFSTGDTVGTGGEDDPDYYYPGAPTFPEDLGRYYQSFVNLNKRATDILIFGPMLALSIVEKQVSNMVVSDFRMSVSRSADTLAGYTSYFMMKYYENDDMFYEERIFNRNYVAGDEEALVVLGFCQGEYCRHYIDAVPDSPAPESIHSYSLKIPKTDWNTELILRLYSLQDNFNEENLFLFYRDVYGEIVQRSSTLDVTLVVTIDEDSDDSNVILTFREPEGETIPAGFTNAVYMSQKLHTSVNKIELYAYNELESELLVSTVEFHENTQIELCKGITLSTYQSIRF